MLDARTSQPSDALHILDAGSCDFQHGFRFDAEPNVELADVLEAIAGLIRFAKASGRIDYLPQTAVICIDVRGPCPVASGSFDKEAN